MGRMLLLVCGLVAGAMIPHDYTVITCEVPPGTYFVEDPMGECARLRDFVCYATEYALPRVKLAEYPCTVRFVYADMDGDMDVDLKDYAEFQRLFTGAIQ